MQAITTTAGYALGTMVLLVQERLQGWSIELTHFHGINVVSCKVVTGIGTPIVNSCLPPSTLEHSPDL